MHMLTKIRCRHPTVIEEPSIEQELLDLQRFVRKSPTISRVVGQVGEDGAKFTSRSTSSRHNKSALGHPRRPFECMTRAAEALPWRRTHWRALIGTIGLDWQFAGSAPIHAGETANLELTTASPPAEETA